MNGHDNKGQKNTFLTGTAREAIVYNELILGFGNVAQSELDETALEALDRIFDFGENDLFFCEASCLAYAAHVLAQESGPKELLVIPPEDGRYAFPRKEETQQYVEEMTEKAKAIAQRLGEDYPRFKGFANVPPGEPYKLLITTTQDYASEGIPGALAWPEMGSYFNHQLGTVNGWVEAVIYPPIEEQPAYQSLREGNRSCGWAVELPDGRIIIGFGGGDKGCHMVDLSDPERPWETEATPFTVAACGGCLVPSMCRKCADAVGETSLDELSKRISRGTSLNRKALNPKSALDAHRGELLLEISEDGTLKEPDFWLRNSRYGFKVCKGDFLFIDSSCINSDCFEPLFIDEIPKGQERYTVVPTDGEVLLVSRNEKRFVFYEALRPTLIANSVYVVWLGEQVNSRYLECWLEGSFAERWFKTAGQTVSEEEMISNGEPILSKGTLASLPVPILEEEIAFQTIARKYGILHRIRELYHEIGILESKEAFAPASAMANPTEEDDARRIVEELSEPVSMW